MIEKNVHAQLVKGQLSLVHALNALLKIVLIALNLLTCLVAEFVIGILN